MTYTFGNIYYCDHPILLHFIIISTENLSRESKALIKNSQAIVNKDMKV